MSEAVVRTGMSEMERFPRRQVAEEIGEDVEVTRDQKLMLIQKYGLMVPWITREVTKPSWMEEEVWKRKLSEFRQMTKGLVKQENNPKRFKTAAVNPKTFQRANDPSLKRKFRTENFNPKNSGGLRKHSGSTLKGRFEN